MTPVSPRTLERPGPLVLVARGLVLLAAAALAVAGFTLAFRDPAAVRAEAAQHACPMHPEVTAAAPGSCPICKMALEPVVTSKRARAAPEIVVDARQALEPARAQKRKSAEPQLIPASSSQFAPGVTWLPETSPPAQPGKPGDGPALGTAKRRVFVDDVRAAAWLEAPGRLAALLYRDELVGLSSAERATFFRAVAPRDGIEARLSDEPPARWDSSTSLVRFALQPEKAKAGEVGWLELPDKSRELLVVPESALLRSSAGPYVLRPGADEHGFTRRPVEIGRILRGQVVVLSGLREGDRVVIGNAFFLDVEQRLDPRAEPGAGAAR